MKRESFSNYKLRPRQELIWSGTPEVDLGLSIYIRYFSLRTFEAIVQHDFSKKAKMPYKFYKSALNGRTTAPSFEEFCKLYSEYFDFDEIETFKPCPGQQSLETVMVENNPAQEPQKVEKIEPGSVYGDTPNNVKQQPITFADLFNKSAQPFEIDGKLYKPHLELIDVDRD